MRRLIYQLLDEVIADPSQKLDALIYECKEPEILKRLEKLGPRLRAVIDDHVPYRGGGPLMNDVVAGHTPLGIGTVFLVMPHVKAGTVRPIAVTGAKRHPSLPDTPTLAESGIRNFEALAYWGVIAPAKTPPTIVERMNSELQKALKDPAVAERLEAQGMPRL